MAEQPWEARRAGADLFAAVTAVIAAERAAAAARGRIPVDAELARAVLRSPALHEANRALLDAMSAEYEPKIAAMIGRDATGLIKAVEPEIRAQVAEEIALAIEQDAETGAHSYRQAQADAATARRIGGRP